MVIEEKSSADTILTLDHNGDMPVKLEMKDNGAVIEVALPHLASLRLANHLAQGLGITAVSAGKSPSRIPLGERFPPEQRTDPSTLRWHVGNDLFPGERAPKLGDEFTLTLFDEPVLAMRVEHDGLKPIPSRTHERLTVSEIKTIANADQPPEGIPYSRAAMKGFQAELHAPITDLHTHFSGQVKAADLMAMALETDRVMKKPDLGITYPQELLDILKIKLTAAQKDKRFTVNAINFDPGRLEEVQLDCETRGKTCVAIRLKDLTEEQRDVITRKMQIAQDDILPFSRFDPELYRFRNPLGKRSELTRSMIMKIAEDYAQNGVRYAELSTGAMLSDPKWFAEMIEAVDEAEKTHGVRLRFLASIPRNFEPQKMLSEMEKVKYAARHPYIAGVDLLGYEFSSAEDLSWALSHIARWASTPEGTDLDPDDGWDFKRDFTIRVHAGETGKRRENVAAVARIPEQYGVKVRFAHALQSDLDSVERDTLRKRIPELSDQGLLAVELCPGSNLAYNNLTRIDKAPLAYWGKKAAVFLGTDGGGALQTNAEQLALDALATGWKLADLERMRAREEAYIDNQRTNEALKTKAFLKLYGTPAKFLEEFSARLEQINGDTIEKQCKKRLPYLIMGASDKNYGQVEPAIKKEIDIGMEMLVRGSDPKKTAVILGRVKKEGVSKAADQALIAHWERDPANAFPVMAVYKKGTTQLADALTFVKEIPEEPSTVPYNMFKTATELPTPAFGIFIGGGAFTKDTLQYYHADPKFPLHGRPFVLMNTADGASKEFSEKKVHESKQFSDGISLLKAIDHQVRHTEEGQQLYPGRLPFAPELYRKGKDGELVLDDQKLNALKSKVQSDLEEAARAARKKAAPGLIATSTAVGVVRRTDKDRRP